MGWKVWDIYTNDMFDPRGEPVYDKHYTVPKWAALLEQFSPESHEDIVLHLLLVSLSLFTDTTKWGQANKQTNNKKKNNPSTQGLYILVSSKK